MKIRVLYEDNIVNGHRNYTTIEVPDGDYTVTLDIDYEQRLAEAKPEKKAEVRRCATLQEMFDIMNEQEYRNWRKHQRHLGSTRAQEYEDDGSGDDSEGGGTWCEPLMSEVTDDRIFRKYELEYERKKEYEDICETIRANFKPETAELIIAVYLNGMSVTDYADSIGDARINASHRLHRADKKLREIFG